MASSPAFCGVDRGGVSALAVRAKGGRRLPPPNNLTTASACKTNLKKAGIVACMSEDTLRLSAGSTILEELDFPFFFRLRVGFSLDYGVHVLVLAFMFLF